MAARADLLAVGGCGGVLTPADPEPTTQLVFDVALGRVSAQTSCNCLFGPYSATGASLPLSPLETTRTACPDPNPETALLAALNSADLAYELGPEELTLIQGPTAVVMLRRAGK